MHGFLFIWIHNVFLMSVRQHRVSVRITWCCKEICLIIFFVWTIRLFVSVEAQGSRTSWFYNQDLAPSWPCVASPSGDDHISTAHITSYSSSAPVHAPPSFSVTYQLVWIGMDCHDHHCPYSGAAVVVLPGLRCSCANLFSILPPCGTSTAATHRGGTSLAQQQATHLLTVEKVKHYYQ